MNIKNKVSNQSQTEIKLWIRPTTKTTASNFVDGKVFLSFICCFNIMASN